jgi:hypothetical protein
MTYRDWLPKLIGRLSFEDQNELFDLLDWGVLTPVEGVLWAQLRVYRRIGTYHYDGPKGWRKTGLRREAPDLPEKETADAPG